MIYALLYIYIYKTLYRKILELPPPFQSRFISYLRKNATEYKLYLVTRRYALTIVNTQLGSCTRKHTARYTANWKKKRGVYLQLTEL